MAISQPVECDIVHCESNAILITLALAVIPRVGEEIDLDIAGSPGADGVYEVVAVRYHMRPRKITRAGDLFGIRLLVRPVA